MILFWSAGLGPGCDFVHFASLKLFYRKAELPASQIIRDIPYWEGADQDPKKHRLDLYLPGGGKKWPVLVFVHGGGWNWGDKSQKIAGAELYANIGRLFASRGIGTAVINYRLLPHVFWKDQIADVARAVSWVYRHIGEYGGDPKSLFLSGHSAGGQLVTRLALDPEPLRVLGLSRAVIRGVIPVSAVGLEITDARDDGYYAERFRNGDTTGSWKREISLLRFVDAKAPPFLILYAGAEPPSIQRQSERLIKTLYAAGVPTEVLVIPHRDHIQILLTLSRPDKTSAPAMTDFIRKENECSSRLFLEKMPRLLPEESVNRAGRKSQGEADGVCAVTHRR